ncbi:hypothetical protein PSTT_05682, partial [Puccinia striiformis]
MRHKEAMEERSREPLELNSESEESDKSDLSVFSEGPACSHPQAPNIHQSQALQPVKSQDQVVVDQVESQDDPNSCTEIYQCSIRLFHTHPVVLYASLATVFSHILRHTPAGVSSYSLRCQTDLVKITLSNGVLNQPPHQIMHSEKMAIRNIPKDIRTVISWLQLSPRLNIYVCCRECFAIYDDSDSTPDLCTHSYIHGKASTSDTETSSKRDHKNPSDLSVCNQPLYKSGDHRTPIRRYATQDMFYWRARLFSRPDVEDALDLSAGRSRKPYDPHCVKDIQDSRIWKQFADPEGHQFTAQSGNLAFGMFTDGINQMVTDNPASMFLSRSLYFLPIEIGRNPENVFLAGIAPGPQEPSLELVNWIIQPIVAQLNTLWKAGLSLSQTHQNPSGRRIFAALLPFFADLPALRCSLGFASFAAKRIWPKGTLENQKIWALEFDNCKTRSEQKRLLEDHGTQYLELLKLEYWNIIDYYVVDSMHNLLLGLINWHTRQFWCILTKKNSLSLSPPKQNKNEKALQTNNLTYMTSISTPSPIPLMPHSTHKQSTWTQAMSLLTPLWTMGGTRAIPVLGKASFGRLKADEWRNLFTIQLTLVLPALWKECEPKTQSLLHNFAHLVSLVNIALASSTSTSCIAAYRHHIKSYVQSCLVLFDGIGLAPNHHMVFHLADSLERFGPSRAWWSFPMERLMGNVLKAPDNNQHDLPGLPLSIQPYIKQLKSLYDPIPFEPEIVTKYQDDYLESPVFNELIAKLNKKFSLSDSIWFAKIVQAYSPVTSRAKFLKNHRVADEVYSVSNVNKNNSVIALKPGLQAAYGQIEKIFQHSRQMPNGKIELH